MNVFSLPQRHLNELARRFEQKQFEHTDDNRVLVPAMGLFVGGVFSIRINKGDRSIEANLFTLEGRTDILAVYFRGGAATATFYLAPYSGNVTPLETWTATGAGSTPAFATTATEFTAYTSATRVAWAPNAAANAAINDTGAEATITLNGSGDIRGLALITSNVKNSTAAGKLITVANFGTPRLGLVSGDEADLGYAITANNV